ncbi:hypothetical protein [Streptomyces sp. NPDC058622]|uniref:hypothetical protein n=1 Tax=Streptomyces sp. NPDC058622 TaxID=3346562 RepID=UPI00366937BF
MGSADVRVYCGDEGHWVLPDPGRLYVHAPLRPSDAPHPLSTLPSPATRLP